MKRDAIDFHAVRFEHEAIHARLLNWARWAGSGRGHSSASPMFIMYRTGYHDPAPFIPVDTLDGSRMEKAVYQLPEKHCAAIRWSYVYGQRGMSIYKACRAFGVRQDTLNELVHDGRAMLKNRSA